MADSNCPPATAEKPQRCRGLSPDWYQLRCCSFFSNPMNRSIIQQTHSRLLNWSGSSLKAPIFYPPFFYSKSFSHICLLKYSWMQFVLFCPAHVIIAFTSETLIISYKLKKQWIVFIKKKLNVNIISWRKKGSLKYHNENNLLLF